MSLICQGTRERVKSGFEEAFWCAASSSSCACSHQEQGLKLHIKCYHLYILPFDAHLKRHFDFAP